MTGKIRRVITGHDATGKAVVISDAPAPFLYESVSRPGFWSNDIWRTTAVPVPITAQAAEPTLGPRRQRPEPSGTVIRINHIPPYRPLDAEAVRKEFAGLGNVSASTYAHGGRHPMMHRTETVDYIIILSGEVFLVLDDSEVHLKAGDVIVQCGTNHAWSNRSNAPCVMAGILIDGQFEPSLAARLKRKED